MPSVLSDLLNMPSRPTKERIATYGKRPDGTPKGPGYFGEIPHPGKPGTFSTELSVGVDFGGEQKLIPLLVPTLTRSEIDAVIQGRETKDIVNKAIEHAVKRMKLGKNPFAEPDEFHPLPKE
jgi:hypothetical protein